MKKVLYEKSEKEIENFLNRNWEDVFEMWLSCIADVGKTLEDTIPHDIRTGLPHVLLYDTGVKSGMMVCRWLFNNFELGRKNVKERTYYTDAFFSRSGVGEIEFIKEADERILRFKGGTFFAKKEGVVGRKVCHYIAGFIAGATNCITKRGYTVEEVRCISNGDDHCDFVVKPKLDKKFGIVKTT